MLSPNSHPIAIEILRRIDVAKLDKGAPTHSRMVLMVGLKYLRRHVSKREAADLRDEVNVLRRKPLRMPKQFR